jgi:hypothetical protein
MLRAHHYLKAVCIATQTIATSNAASVSNEVVIPYSGLHLLLSGQHTARVPTGGAAVVLPAEDPLYVELQNTTGSDIRYRWLGIERSFSCRLTDRSGQEVPTTDLGEALSAGPLGEEKTYAARFRTIRSGATQEFKFPSVDRLFQLPSPGEYLLELRYWYHEKNSRGYRKSQPMLMLVVHSAAPRPTGFSAATNGLYVTVRGSGQTDADLRARYDMDMIWRPFSTTGVVALALPDRPFGIRFTMVGPDGSDVPKTELGEKFGARFDALRSPHNCKLDRVHAAPEWQTQEILSAEILPAPNKLFKMSKQGIYVLHAEFQLFRAEGTNWHSSPIRFPAARLEIDKSDRGAL